MTTRVYDIRNWKQENVSGQAILMRPGMAVLSRRLGATGVAIVVIVLLASVYSSSSGLVRSGPYAGSVQGGLLLLMGMLAALGVLAPVSCLWSCLRIERTPRGDLAVHHRGIILASTREWSVRDFERIVPDVKEVLRTSRQKRFHIWWFSANLIAATANSENIEFRLVEQKDASSLYFPQVVQKFSQSLSQLTGLPAVGFEGIVPVRSGGRSRVRVVSRGPVTNRQFFSSPDEMPPDIRARFEQLKAEADMRGGSGAFRNVSECITITQNGETHTYHSVDEMPPEVRTRFEEVRRMAKGGPVPPGVSIRTDEDFFETYDG